MRINILNNKINYKEENLLRIYRILIKVIIYLRNKLIFGKYRDIII